MQKSFNINVPDHVDPENEGRYIAAAQARIMENARKGSLKRWLTEGEDHQELYDLNIDPYENSNLLLDGESEEEILIIKALENRINQLRN